MRKMLWISPVVGALVTIGGMAVAQDPPQEIPPPEPEPEQEAVLKPQFWTFEPGLASWGLRGNENRFRHYSTAARGIFLSNLEFRPAAHGGVSGFGLVRGLGRDAGVAAGRAEFNYGQTQLLANYSSFRFSEGVVSEVPLSERRSGAISVRHYLRPELSFQVEYDRSDLNQHFEPQRSSSDEWMRVWNAALYGRLGNGRVAAGYRDWRFVDRTATLPKTNSKTWHAAYALDLTPSLSLDARFADTRLDQDQRPDAKVQSWWIRGGLQLGDSTQLGLRYARSLYDYPATLVAYVKKRTSGSIWLDQWWRGWSFGLSYTRSDAERFREDHAFVDLPKWDDWRVRVVGRLHPSLKWTASGALTRGFNLPPSGTDDARVMAWRRQATFMTRLDGYWDQGSAFVGYTFAQRENPARGVDVRSYSWILGGSWQVRPDLDLYAEIAGDTYNASSENVGHPDLDSFFSGSTVTVVGFRWNLRPEWTLGASFTTFGTQNDNPLLLPDGNTRGRFLTAELAYRHPGGNIVMLSVSPWSYRDRVSSPMDYDATIIMLSARIRF